MAYILAIERKLDLPATITLLEQYEETPTLNADQNEQNTGETSEATTTAVAAKAKHSRQVTCFFCEKLGHLQNDCRLYLKAKKRLKKKKEKSKKRARHESSSESESSSSSSDDKDKGKGKA